MIIRGKLRDQDGCLGINNNHNCCIHFLRAFAIILVVTYHLFPSLIPLGFVGVDIFFVISGFLSASILQRKKSIFQYYESRILRLAPALLFSIAVSFLVFSFYFFVDELEGFRSDIHYSLIGLQNLHLADLPIGYFARDIIFEPAAHLWSLSVEFCFYLVTPVLYAYIKKEKLLVATIICISLSFFYFLYHQFVGKDIYYSAFGRYWEFLSGFLLFYIINISEIKPKKIFLVPIFSFVILLFMDKNILFGMDASILAVAWSLLFIALYFKTDYFFSK